MGIDRFKQTRREFCMRTLTAAAAGGVLATLLEGCGGNGLTGPSSLQNLPLVTASDVPGGVSVTIDASSPLSAVGSLALVQSPSALALVAHTAQTSFTAFSPVCTHMACTITDYSGQNFICPCHGSQFGTNGQVVNGPASIPLRQFQTQFSNGVLTITA